MMHAAIYARYSTELQEERSIEDQLALCREYAAKHGYRVMKEYRDAGLSGASTVNRPGLQQLMAAAKNSQFDIVIVEALDRLSRDIADMADIHKRLTYQGVEIRGVHEGKVDTVLIGLRGLVGQMFREDNAKKIRRGLAGRVRDGLHAGGRAYGYRPDPGSKGQLVIDEAEAAVVLRIFNEFATGCSPRSIARRLNEEGVPPPRGGAWNASTINGNADRGNGLLRNELYVGKIVWNKVQMVRNPDTGLRVSRPNPPEQWQRARVEAYRIVADDLFMQVAQRLEARRVERPDKQRRAKRILSGLMKCGVCGAGMSACGKDKSGRVRIRCSAHRESGTCPDPKTFYLDAVEDGVLQNIAQELASPDHLAIFAESYVSRRKQLALDARKRRDRLAGQISEKAQEIDRLINAVATGAIAAEDVGPRLDRTKSEKAQLEKVLSEAPEVLDAATLQPQAIKRFAGMLNNLRDELNRGMQASNAEAVTNIRELIDRVIVERDTAIQGEIALQIHGKLNALIETPRFARDGVVNGGSGGGIRTPDTRIMIPLL
jgi:site-specific DNA recombinase